MAKVNIDIANFNLTYGKEELPLLTHFNDFIYPAFKSKIEREVDGNKYFFKSVKLIETRQGIAMKGLIVKDTVLEVKSLVEEGELVETNKEYSSAPYSFFCIFLKNHRMIFAPNQKGSPDIRSFNVTTRYILGQYRKIENERIKKEIEEVIDNTKSEKPKLIPYFDLRVTGIPQKDEILKQLKRVKKINNLKIRFYPLNGEDIDNSDIINDQIRGIREKLGSNTGNLVFNSPENKIETAQFIEDLGETVDASLNVTFPSGSTGKIKNNNFSEKYQFTIDSDQVSEKEKELIDNMLNVPSLIKTSGSNENIYKKFVDKIKNLL